MKTDALINWIYEGMPGKFTLVFFGLPKFIVPHIGYIRGFNVYVVMN